MQIEWKTRLCTVNDKLGYFHAWEHYSKPLEASPLICLLYTSDAADEL